MPGSSNGGNFGLVKGGAGILQLTGTNRYTGDTAVRGGTLQLQSPDLATNSTISIESGAVLRLDFTGTNTVWGLITNGVVLAPGVYHAGNAAPFIAGQGRLRVDEIDPPPPAVVWSGGSAPDLDWPNAGNWLPVAVPGKITDVRFIDLGATSDGVSANNIVPAKMAVRSLAYAQTNGYHHTLIRPGVTLTVSNDASGIVVQAGTETQVAAAQQTTNVVSGAGGTLKIVGTHSGSAFVVRESHATVGPHRATLDLSDLDRLELAVGQLAVAVQGSIIRPAGTLLLARTNTITLAGTAPSLALGDGSGNGGNALLRLGLSNALFTDSVLVSGRKSIATMQFNPAFTGDNPSLMLRGRSASRVSTFAIGDNAGTVNSGITTVGTVDWSGGTVDVLADTLVVGRSQSGAGAGAASGTLTFSAGTLDVNTLELGYQVTNTVSSVASGTVNVNGTATLRVNASLRLARHTGAGTAPAGTLNVKGGTLYADSIVTENPGTSALTVTNGTLCVASHAGTAAAPLGTLRLSNARLELPVASGLTNLFVNTLLADPAATNRLLITALPTITGYPARFALLRYATLNAFAFELDALPGTAHLGSLSNNAAAGTVELIVTPAAPPQFASVGSDAGGSFALSGSGPEGATYRVFATTNLTLPFSAWTEVATGSFSGGVFTFTDTQATNFPQRFYRTVTP
jgi:autotransporter-associated beta strand protein